MKAKWLLEQDTFDEDLQPIIDAISYLGHEYEIVQYKPTFADIPTGLAYTFEPDDCVVVYGSLQLCQAMRREAEWIPGVYCDLKKYKCSYYYPFFGDFLLNSNYIMLPYGELKRRKEFLFETVGNNGCLFLRPDSGFKEFTGSISLYNNWDRDLEFFNRYGFDDSLLTIVAEPRNITNEYRFVVADRKVLPGSKYRDRAGSNRSNYVPSSVHTFAQYVVDTVKYDPEPVWCLDLCETKSGEIYVLEVGCFSGAGLYDTPKRIIIEKVSQAALSEWQDYH